MIRKIDFSDDVLPLYEAEAARLKLSLSQYINLLLQGYFRPQSGPSPAPTRPAPGPDTALVGPGTDTATRVEDLNSKSSPEEKEEKPNTLCAASSPETGELVLFPDLAAVETAKEAARKKRDAERETELAWRIEQTWESYLFAREAFFRDVSGVRPGSKPDRRLVAADIRQALLLHDRDRLAPGDRERWRRESPVLAAGVGIFYDPWITGTSPQNDARNGGRRYLEPWRPWRPQRGKPDPVTRYSELCFEVRDQEAARGVP